MVDTCSIDECTGKVQARGWCMKHYLRWHRRGTLDLVGRAGNRWAGVEVTYNAAHLRVRTARGRAADHRCAHCGEQAKQWAYDHNDPDEKYLARRGPYSANPAHYMPLCVPCHVTFDRSRKKETA